MSRKWPQTEVIYHNLVGEARLAAGLLPIHSIT